MAKPGPYLGSMGSAVTGVASRLTLASEATGEWTSAGADAAPTAPPATASAAAEVHSPVGSEASVSREATPVTAEPIEPK